MGLKKGTCGELSISIQIFLCGTLRLASAETGEDADALLSMSATGTAEASKMACGSINITLAETGNRCQVTIVYLCAASYRGDTNTRKRCVALLVDALDLGAGPDRG